MANHLPRMVTLRHQIHNLTNEQYQVFWNRIGKKQTMRSAIDFILWEGLLKTPESRRDTVISFASQQAKWVSENIKTKPKEEEKEEEKSRHCLISMTSDVVGKMAAYLSKKDYFQLTKCSRFLYCCIEQPNQLRIMNTLKQKFVNVTVSTFSRFYHLEELWVTASMFENIAYRLQTQRNVLPNLTKFIIDAQYSPSFFEIPTTPTCMSFSNVNAVTFYRFGNPLAKEFARVVFSNYLRYFKNVPLH